MYVQQQLEIKRAAMNTVEHLSLLHAGESSGYMSRSGITESSGSLMPRFLRNCQTDSRVVVPACNTTCSGGVFPFLHILAKAYGTFGEGGPRKGEII